MHVLADRHKGADGLSRRLPAPEDEVKENDIEDWIDQAYGFAVEMLNWSEFPPGFRSTVSGRRLKATQHQKTETQLTLTTDEARITIPRSEKARKQDEDIARIREFLDDSRRKEGMEGKEFQRLVKRAGGYFVMDQKLWKRHPTGRHQLFVEESKRGKLIKEAHDDLGHKGPFVTWTRLLERFWWPLLDQDVQWYCRSCHQCQVRQINKIVIPPTVATPASLFRRVHMDTMLMPKAGGYMGIVHARCSLSGYPECRPLRRETGKTIAAFIFEEILCRWGAVEEIVTDNGSAFVKALDELGRKYRIHNIRISPYNSQANGIIERAHRPLRDALVKAADGDESRWPSVLHSVLWAEWVTIQRATKRSPYWIAHGVEPSFPFDLAEATYLVLPLDTPMSTEDLLAIRARQLQKCPEDLEAIKGRILKARQESVRQFVEKHQHQIRDFDFKPGALVLVRNSAIESNLDRKSKPRFFGPMVVVNRTTRGAYKLAELDRTISNYRYAAFRVVPYYPR